MTCLETPNEDEHCAGDGVSGLGGDCDGFNVVASLFNFPEFDAVV